MQTPGPMLLPIMNTASFGISAHEEGAGLAWSLDTQRGHSLRCSWSPWLLGHHAHMQCCQLPPFAVVLLSGASLCLQTLPVGPLGTCGSPAEYMQSWGPGRICG